MNIQALIAALLSLLPQRETQLLTPVPKPTPTPTPQADDLETRIKKGLEDYGSPLATISGEMAQVGRNLPHQALPAALAIKESSGFKEIPGNERMRQYQNPYGIKPGGSLVQYPDVVTATLGGGAQKGLKGTLLDSGYYSDYLNSGDLTDFMKAYTPYDIENQVDIVSEILNQYFQ